MLLVTGADREVGYKKLIAWKLADEFAREVYKVSAKFPNDEVFGLTAQLRRAVLSVVLNIVEGHSRNNRNEFRRFLKISLGSLAEVDYILLFSSEIGYLEKGDYQNLLKMRESCGGVLWKLMKSI